MTAIHLFGGFETPTLLKVILIAIFGFEAGIVLNDYVDRDLDKKDIDNSLTSYFRPFKTRPLAKGTLKSQTALFTMIFFAAISVVLILTLTTTHKYYVLTLMVYAYIVEYFYQTKKRQQSFPWAQLIGRTDFALFPVAGYLIIAKPDINALFYFLYFYTLAEAHLAVNDLADYKNDLARKLFSVPKIFGINGTVTWISGFTIFHLFFATFFILRVNPHALAGFLISFIFIIFTAIFISIKKTPSAALKVLPLLHLSMAIQSLSLIFLH